MYLIADLAMCVMIYLTEAESGQGTPGRTTRRGVLGKAGKYSDKNLYVLIINC